MRIATLAACGVAILGLAASVLAANPAPSLRVSLPDGTVIARLQLPHDGSFALRYRNSLYGTLAEERFVATPGGELRLVGLAADQLAVLEEYYATNQPARRAGGMWTAPPAHAPVVETLRIAATDRGERTLLVAGREAVDLWRYVDDAAPSVLLELEA